MRKLLLALTLAAGACQQAAPDQQATPDPAAKAPATASASASAAPDTQRAHDWLVRSLEENFSVEGRESENSDLTSTASIYTKRYREYKTDAIGLEYDDDLTEEQFTKKWQGTYDTKRAGAGGFLISAQDWNTIKVTRCDLKSTAADGSAIFSVVLTEQSDKAQYPHDIKVIPVGQSFQIDDVRD